MKTIKLTNKFTAIALVALSLVLTTSCSSNDEEEDPKGGGNSEEPKDSNAVELKTLTDNLELDASKKYTIKSIVQVPDGKTLTIPAGTEIISTKGKFYIAVLKGGKINVNGTKEKPVIMKSEKGGSGDWGGLVICGKANTTNSAGTAEVDNLPYGGTVETDNSGSINYLIIKDSGFNIDTKKQFNGLTLYAVGSMTTISNIAIINGKDDGVEFFGGAVNTTNIYLKNNADDSIDWTEGWKGTLNNALVEFDSSFAYQTIVEADGTGITTFPIINNLKATASVTGEGTALQFKNASKATLTKVTLSGFGTQFKLDGTAGLADISINGGVANQTGTYAAAVDADLDFSWVK